MITVADIVHSGQPETSRAPQYQSVMALWSVNGHRVATVPSLDRCIPIGARACRIVCVVLTTAGARMGPRRPARARTQDQLRGDVVRDGRQQHQYRGRGPRVGRGADLVGMGLEPAAQVCRGVVVCDLRRHQVPGIGAAARHCCEHACPNVREASLGRRANMAHGMARAARTRPSCTWVTAMAIDPTL